MRAGLRIQCKLDYIQKWEVSDPIFFSRRRRKLGSSVSFFIKMVVTRSARFRGA